MQILPYLRLIRPTNLIFGALTQWLLAWALSEDGWAHVVLPTFWLGCMAMVCTAAAANVLNDWYDQEADRTNRPHRRWVGVEVSGRQALVYSASLELAALGFGWWSGVWPLIVLTVGLGLALWAYSAYLKGIALIGNLWAAASTALGIGAVYWAVPGLDTDALWFYLGFAFGTGLAREMAKDLEDAPGDARQGYKTLPIVWGNERSILLLRAWLILLMAALVTAIYQSANWAWATGLVLTTGGLGLAYQQAGEAQGPADWHRISTLLKICMGLGVATLVVF